LRKRQPILSARSSEDHIHRRKPADERPLIMTVLPVPVTYRYVPSASAGCKLNGRERHQRDATRKRHGSRQRAGASWQEPPGGSPADINLIRARAKIRLAVRAAGSVGTRPTVTCGGNTMRSRLACKTMSNFWRKLEAESRSLVVVRPAMENGESLTPEVATLSRAREGKGYKEWRLLVGLQNSGGRLQPVWHSLSWIARS
jgi:hypothetical protein